MNKTETLEPARNLPPDVCQAHRWAGSRSPCCNWVALISGAAMVADWVSGYYGFGSLMALLVCLWLIWQQRANFR